MTICPKCQHLRESASTAPAWQCPSCGVAYGKVAHAPPSSHASTKQLSSSRMPKSGGVPLAKLLLTVAVLWGAWIGAKAFIGPQGPGSGRGAISTEQLHALAATVRPEEVVMYSTPECPNCAQAKSWLRQYGFAFTECDMRASARCEHEFRALGADGTPYLIVRGHHMKDGFDSDEFLAALKT